MHFEIQTSPKSPVAIIRSSKMVKGQRKTKQHGRITGCTLEQLRKFKEIFKGRELETNDNNLTVTASKECGASLSILSSLLLSTSSKS